MPCLFLWKIQVPALTQVLLGAQNQAWQWQEEQLLTLELEPSLVALSPADLLEEQWLTLELEFSLVGLDLEDLLGHQK